MPRLINILAVAIVLLGAALAVGMTLLAVEALNEAVGSEAGSRETFALMKFICGASGAICAGVVMVVGALRQLRKPTPVAGREVATSAISLLLFAAILPIAHSRPAMLFLVILCFFALRHALVTRATAKASGVH